MTHASVLVLNADLGPLHQVGLRHAIRMLWRRVAEIQEAEPDIRYESIGGLPTVIRLVKYIVTKWRYTRGPKWTRRGVMVRDGHRCAYCHGSATTVDHVTPQSRGGRGTWDNTVASCYGCNQRKGDRTPAEAGMTLLIRPSPPTWSAALPNVA